MMRKLIVLLAMVATPALAQETIGAWRVQSAPAVSGSGMRGVAHTDLKAKLGLVIKCDEPGDEQLYAVLVTQTYVGGADNRMGSRTFEYSVDGKPPQSVYATHYNQRVELPKIKRDTLTADFLLAIARGSMLTLTVKDHNDSPTTARIPLTGAREALGKVTAICQDMVNAKVVK